MWNWLLQNGQSIIIKYIAVILDAPSRSVVDKFVDVLVKFSLNFPPQYKQQWFTAGFIKIPGDVLTEEEKTRHLERIMKEPAKEDAIIDNFDTIAKRARNSINRGN